MVNVSTHGWNNNYGESFGDENAWFATKPFQKINTPDIQTTVSSSTWQINY